MAASVKPRTIAPYRDLAWFFVKYGRRTDIVSSDEFGGTASADEAAPDRIADAEELARDLESMGPTFIKLGQLLATRADLLPAPYLDALARLQDAVAPFPFHDVEDIVQAELGVRLSKAFREFDPEPLAAASLGQVHRAVLRSGRDVAVKVQRPGIRERVLEDLAALDRVVSLVVRYSGSARQIDAPRLIDEFRRTLLAELDYRQEARNLVAIGGQLREFRRIVVPAPIFDYTTPRVLTMEYVRGTNITKVSALERIEVDGCGLAGELFEAYLQQILIDGVFHADPHPGNVFLTEDHRLALIDLGMVGRISSTVQEQLIRLMLAIGEGRGDAAASVAIEVGERLENFDEMMLRRQVSDVVMRHQHTSLADISIGRVMLDLARAGGQHGLRMSPDLAMLGKTLLNLDQIGRCLDPRIDVNALMRTNAVELMRRRMMKSASPGNLFASMLDVKDFAARLPGRVNRILDSLATNDLRLKVEVIDEGSIIEGLQKVANRIALGLVLAALIVGAAMLMRVPTTFTLFGYPGLAILLFAGAAGGGIWLAATILSGDAKTTRQ
jgi:ubiquinone biosynthesis protein